MIASQHPVPGWNWTAEYQTSGIPVVTSSFGIGTSPIRVDFAFVTKNVVIDVTGSAPLRVGFTYNGVNGVVDNNYFIVRPNTTIEFEVRVKSVFVRADSGTTGFSLLAGLTTIPAKQMPTLTGSIGSGSLYWSGIG